MYDCKMARRTLLLDFKTLTPFRINYRQALDELASTYPQIAKSASADIFAQIELVKEKAPKKEFDEFTLKFSKILDEVETRQAGKFSLNVGVKSGLAALESLDVTTIALTEMGKAGAEVFLKEKGIDNYVDELVARETLGEPWDLASRLNKARGRDIAIEDCTYFCNTLSDAKTAKSSNFKIVVLPSKGERLDLVMLEKPLGMIMSLEEIPNLLSLEASRNARAKPEFVSTEPSEGRDGSSEQMS